MESSSIRAPIAYGIVYYPHRRVCNPPRSTEPRANPPLPHRTPRFSILACRATDERYDSSASASRPGGQATGGAEALWGNQMAYGMGSRQMYGFGGQLDAEVNYGLPVGARFVGTPKVGISTRRTAGSVNER